MEAAVTEFFAEQDEAMQDTNTGGAQQLGARVDLELLEGEPLVEVLHQLHLLPPRSLRHPPEALLRKRNLQL